MTTRILSILLLGMTLAQAQTNSVLLKVGDKAPDFILKTLDHTDWNKSQAAGILQIERSTLDRKIKGYNLKRDEE